MFGCIDAGAASCFWDFGQLKLYRQNCLSVAAEGPGRALAVGLISWGVGIEGGG